MSTTEREPDCGLLKPYLSWAGARDAATMKAKTTGTTMAPVVCVGHWHIRPEGAAPTVPDDDLPRDHGGTPAVVVAGGTIVDDYGWLLYVVLITYDCAECGTAVARWFTVHPEGSIDQRYCSRACTARARQRRKRANARARDAAAEQAGQERLAEVRKRMCEDKRRYGSEGSAVRFIVRSARRFAVPQRAYRCPHCAGWHVTVKRAVTVPTPG